MTPYAPYAWQKKRETIAAASLKSKRLNVVGFMNKNNVLTSYTSECSVSSEASAACIGNFCEKYDKSKKNIL